MPLKPLLSFGEFIDFLSGVVVLALGMYVLARAPPRAVNRLLGVLGVALGVLFLAWSTVTPDDPLHPIFELLVYVGGSAAAISLVALVLMFPKPSSRRDLPALLAIGLWTLVLFPALVLGANPGAARAFVAAEVWLAFFRGGFYAALLLLAFRQATATGVAQERQRLAAALMSFALLLFLAPAAGWELVSDHPSDRAFALFGLAMCGLLACWWAWQSYRTRAAAARWVALVCILAPLVGVGLGALAGGVSQGRAFGFWGTTRLLMVAAFGYAILRHQLLDLDIRLKRGIRQGTVAAFFLATFFAASEWAAYFFGESTGSAYVGIAFAALLVLALAPLQRIAERLAESVLPGVSTSADYLTYRRLQLYRASLEAAYQDGAVTAKERAVLDRLGESLEIRPEDAAALEREVAAAAGVDG